MPLPKPITKKPVDRLSMLRKQLDGGNRLPQTGATLQASSGGAPAGSRAMGGIPPPAIPPAPQIPPANIPSSLQAVSGRVPSITGAGVGVNADRVNAGNTLPGQHLTPEGDTAIDRDAAHIDVGGTPDVGGAPPRPSPNGATTDPNAPPPVDAGGPGATGGGGGQGDLNEMSQDFISELINEARNGGELSPEETALLQELFGDKMGQSLVDQRASMGRAGFQSSGALGAMEGDIRRKSAQSQSQATFDLQRQEKQDAINNALKGMGLGNDLQQILADQTLTEKLIEMLQGDPNAAEDPVAAADVPFDPGDPFTPPPPPTTDADNNGIDDNTGAGNGFSTKPVDPRVKAEAEDWTSPIPPVFHLTEGYQGSDGEYDYFKGLDGKIWRMPIDRG